MKIFSALFLCVFGLVGLMHCNNGVGASIDINSVSAGEVQDFSIWSKFGEASNEQEIYVNVRHIVHKVPAATTRSLPPKQDLVNHNYTMCSGATPWSRPYQFKALPCVDLIEPPKSSGRRKRATSSDPVVNSMHCTYSDDFRFDICSKLKIQGSGGPTTKLQLCSRAYYVDGSYVVSSDGRESCVDLDYCASKYPTGKC